MLRHFFLLLLFPSVFPIFDGDFSFDLSVVTFLKFSCYFVHGLGYFVIKEPFVCTLLLGPGPLNC